MKKTNKFIILTILLLSLFIGCTTSNPLQEYQLVVTVSYWNGWTSDYESEETTYIYSIEKNEPIIIPSDFGQTLTVTITKTAQDSITIKTDQPMSDNEDGTINLGSMKTSFEVSLSKELLLITTSTDMGTIFLFEIERK